MSDPRTYPTLHPFWEGYISETKATHRRAEKTLLARIKALEADLAAAQARADALAEKLEKVAKEAREAHEVLDEWNSYLLDDDYGKEMIFANKLATRLSATLAQITRGKADDHTD